MSKKKITKEEWRDIPSINGKCFDKYEVSSSGQIKNKKSGHIFSNKPNNAGYVRNPYRDNDGAKWSMCAHIVVAKTFLGDPASRDLTVDHINRNRSDNRVVNLRWATRKQQITNSDKLKRVNKGQPIIQYNMEMDEIKRWVNIATAGNELGMHKGNISNACRGKLNSTGGFKWAYERQDLPGEIWKKHKTLGVFVSDMGRIKSSKHIIYGSKTNNGYLMYRKKGVHVIIAEAFLHNPKKKPEVNHKDKDCTNNKLENLEWVTGSEQMIHSHKNSNADRYSTARIVKQYDLEGNFIKEYKSISEASRLTGCSRAGISGVCSKDRNSTKDFIFKYSNKKASKLSIRTYSNKIDCIHDSGNIITYVNVATAAVDLKIYRSVIYDNLRGVTTKTKHGYRFQYHKNK